MILKLELLNEGINCPHCNTYTDALHQNRPILVRDLAICGQQVYLHVPRRQFICSGCRKYPTERLTFMDSKRKYTSRYERYIHEQVKKLTVEEEGCAEALTAEQVSNIFERIESSKKKIGAVQND